MSNYIKFFVLCMLVVNVQTSPEQQIARANESTEEKIYYTLAGNDLTEDDLSSRLYEFVPLLDHKTGTTMP